MRSEENNIFSQLFRIQISHMLFKKFFNYLFCLDCGTFPVCDSCKIDKQNILDRQKADAWPTNYVKKFKKNNHKSIYG